MENELKDKIKVKFYDTDENQQMTPFSFFNYMQDIALRNAGSLHFGYEDLYSKGMIWVLSRVKLTINELPKWNDTFYLTTRPQGADGVFALRDFVYENDKGEKIAYGATYWLVLKADTLRPQRVNEALSEFNYDCERPDDFPLLQKLTVKGDKIKTTSHIPHYSEIDLNHHVNNANYTKWTIDIFEYEFLRTHKLQSIQINYISAAKYGDNLELSLFDAGDNRFFVECLETTKNTKIYQAEVLFVQ